LRSFIATALFPDGLGAATFPTAVVRLLAP